MRNRHLKHYTEIFAEPRLYRKQTPISSSSMALDFKCHEPKPNLSQDHFTKFVLTEIERSWLSKPYFFYQRKSSLIQLLFGLPPGYHGCEISVHFYNYAAYSCSSICGWKSRHLLTWLNLVDSEHFYDCCGESKRIGDTFCASRKRSPNVV